RAGGRESQTERPGAHPESRGGIYLPEFQPDRRSQRLRERGAALNLPRHGLQGAKAAGAKEAGEGWDVAPHEALSLAAFRRSAATPGGSASAGGQPHRYFWPMSPRVISIRR